MTARPNQPLFKPTLERLTERFGHIGDPLRWYGVNEYGLQEALATVDHVIDRNSLLIDTNRARSKISVAYVTARLTKNREMESIPKFTAEAERFGIVSHIGTIAAAELLLDNSYANGFVGERHGAMTAHYVTLDGLCATLRQCQQPGLLSRFVVNREGEAELAVQELLPAAREVIASTIEPSLTGDL